MKYTQVKGRRIKSSRYDSATISYESTAYIDYTWICDLNGNQHWHKMTGETTYLWGSSHSCRIRSVRAFRRRLKQWSNQLPKGTKLILVSYFRRNDVIGVIR
jgi:hypothetical protein